MKKKAKPKGKSLAYTSHAKSMPVAPTTAGVSTHSSIYSTIGGKRGATKQQAKVNTKGKLSA